ncbi:hypothetical protein [Subtercola lobariae]|uniref:SnoaL-like domain-containing protein n=1 Tax=Subtercola lobariae TaxID=1588641 RepID=A0A917EUU2_9MICO|nr:hypothetical protein [Subtercola lobariae]GGF17586.1 hypothetical protein GCM10011399_09170 [Subtercola lobariae]
MNDISEVTQLVLRERQARDRGWWGQLAECYADDSHVKVSWFDGNGADFVTESTASISSTPSFPWLQAIPSI